jgi:hypothetical protein
MGGGYNSTGGTHTHSGREADDSQGAGQTLMDAISDILGDLGVPSVAEMNVNENYTITVDGFEDLTIEKIGDGRLSVGHYYTQRGDLMSDPEIVFQINCEEWVPIRYTQHPGIHQHDENGLPRVKNYVRKWDKNLESQGYVNAAKNQPTEPRGQQ